LHDKIKNKKGYNMNYAFKALSLSIIASATLFAGGGAAPVESDIASVNTDWQIALKAGTLGLGVDIVRPFNDQFAARVNVNGLRIHDYKFDVAKEVKMDIKGVDMAANIDLLTAGALLDWHPFHNGFLLSAGGYYNGNKVSGVAKVNGTVKYEGTDYDQNDIKQITSEVTFNNKFAPYAGIGYSNITESGWGLSWDIGVMYHGKPKVATTVDYADGAPRKAEIESKKIDADKKANDEIAKHAIANFYPVVRVGFRYNF
jgi:hypothetical protein